MKPSLLARGLILAATALLPSVGRAQQPAPPAPKPTPAPYSPLRWEAAIAKFEKADQAALPASGGVVFVGSSSIVGWKTLKQDFPGVNVLNRGFGGSRLADSTYFADRVVIPYAPKTVVLYAGDNDLAAGMTPYEVARDFRRFVVTVRRALPQTRVVFIAIKPSLARWKNRAAIEETNRRIWEWSAAQENVAFVDVYPLMLGTDGTPRPELYVKDGLHMTPAGYALWKDPVAKAL